MDRAFASGASGTPPSAPASPSIGYPTKGNAGAGTPATKPGEYWYHMITEELRGIITAAGLTPSQNDLTQLLQALPAALASRPEMARSFASNGYQKLPGGLIIQWGITGAIAAGGSVTVTFPIAFPNGIKTTQVSPDYTGGSATLTKCAGVQWVSATQFTIALNGPNGSTGVPWLAIGN